MDSTTIINFLQQYMPDDVSSMVYGLLCIAVPFLWRMLAVWASNRPTTWYWNPITKKFVVGRISKLLAVLFTRGVNDCNIKYQDKLPPEAIKELRKRIDKTYPVNLGGGK